MAGLFEHFLGTRKSHLSDSLKSPNLPFVELRGDPAGIKSWI